MLTFNIYSDALRTWPNTGFKVHLTDFINDLGEGIEYTLTKLDTCIDLLKGKSDLQDDLDRMDL